MTTRWLGMLLALAGLGISAGCESTVRSFAEASATWAMQHDADDLLDDMEARPCPAARPIVVLSGIYDPGIGSGLLASRLERVLDDNAQVISIAFVGAPTFDECRDRVISAVEDAWPSTDPDATIEVDVVAVSMGGLVARYAARPVYDGPRLRVRRIFSICSPHRGAQLAQLPSFDPRVLDMRAGSAFLYQLNGCCRADDPEIIAYARPGDIFVGDRLVAPPNGDVRWFTPGPFESAHIYASADPRIVADIARQLRVESHAAPHTVASRPEFDRPSERPLVAESRESSGTQAILCQSVSDARTSSPDS